VRRPRVTLIERSRERFAWGMAYSAPHPSQRLNVRAAGMSAFADDPTYFVRWLDAIVAGHIEDRLLQPDRLEEVLAPVLDRRHERDERRQEHIAELNRRAAEKDLRLKRLYDAIGSGVADLPDRR